MGDAVFSCPSNAPIADKVGVLGRLGLDVERLVIGMLCRVFEEVRVGFCNEHAEPTLSEVVEGVVVR